MKCKALAFGFDYAFPLYGPEYKDIYEIGTAYERYKCKRGKWRWKVRWDDGCDKDALEEHLHLTRQTIAESLDEHAFEAKVRYVSKYYDMESDMCPYDKMSVTNRRLVVLAARFLFRRTTVGLRERLNAVRYPVT